MPAIPKKQQIAARENSYGAEEAIMSKNRFGIVVAAAMVLAGAWTSPALADKILRQASDLSMGGKESLDPLSPVRFWEVNDLLYSRLVRLSPTGEVEPELALSWTPNADAANGSFKLREGVLVMKGPPAGQDQAHDPASPAAAEASR